MDITWIQKAYTNPAYRNLCDLVITLQDGTKIYAHKIIVFSIKYFRNLAKITQSAIMEIDFPYVSPTVIRAAIDYLYGITTNCEIIDLIECKNILDVDYEQDIIKLHAANSFDFLLITYCTQDISDRIPIIKYLRNNLPFDYDTTKIRSIVPNIHPLTLSAIKYECVEVVAVESGSVIDCVEFMTDTGEHINHSFDFDAMRVDKIKIYCDKFAIIFGTPCTYDSTNFAVRFINIRNGSQCRINVIRNIIIFSGKYVLYENGTHFNVIDLEMMVSVHSSYTGTYSTSVNKINKFLHENNDPRQFKWDDLNLVFIELTTA